ncbi:MAG: GNAT family N-acetyltransferase [Burkholderiaceae bacterium]|nr:GNAT family N-acetyltransferase [Burkholderiaceae bacterium]
MAFDIPVIETERLRLRAFAAADLDAYATMCADAEVMRFVGDGGPIDRDAAWRQMALFLGHWPLRGFGMWALEERTSGGRGLATEACRAALARRAAFGIERLISLIRPGNARSAAVAERLGATLARTADFLGAPVQVWEHPRR